MYSCKAHGFLCGAKLGHAIRQLRDLVRKEADDPAFEEARDWLNHVERARVAGYLKYKAIATVNREDLCKLAQDIGKHSPNTPSTLQRAVLERAVNYWNAESELASKRDIAIELTTPWHEDGGVESGNRLRSSKNYLQLSKEGHAKTLVFCNQVIVEIRAAPMTCDPVIDAAAAEVMSTLLLVATIAGSTKDAVPLSTVEAIVRARPWMPHAAASAIIKAEPYWKGELDVYMRHSPEVKKWRPTLSQCMTDIASTQDAPTFDFLDRLIADMPTIKASLPDAEYNDLSVITGKSLDTYFANAMALVKGSAGEATDDAHQCAWGLQKAAGAIYTGRRASEMRTRSLVHVASEDSKRALPSFTSEAIQIVTKKMDAFHDIAEDAMFDSALALVPACTEWADWPDACPSGLGLTSAKQLCHRVKLAKALAGAIATLHHKDTIFDNAAAEAALDHSVGAFMGLVAQCQCIRTDLDDPTNASSITRGTWMEDLLGNSLGMKELLFSARLAMYTKLLSEQDGAVPLEKFKGGIVDKSWHADLSKDISSEDSLASGSCQSFLKNCPYDSLKKEGPEKVAIKDNVNNLGVSFD
ncbi:unnamed protein product, partial [Prorocentrum cordatum]